MLVSIRYIILDLRLLLRIIIVRLFLFIRFKVGIWKIEVYIIIDKCEIILNFFWVDSCYISWDFDDLE